MDKSSAAEKFCCRNNFCRNPEAEDVTAKQSDFYLHSTFFIHSTSIYIITFFHHCKGWLGSE